MQYYNSSLSTCHMFLLHPRIHNTTPSGLLYTSPSCIWLLEVISGCQRLYLAIRGCIWPSEIASSHQRSYLAIRGCIWLSEVVSGCQRSYLVTRGQIWLPEGLPATSCICLLEISILLQQHLQQYITVIMFLPGNKQYCCSQILSSSLSLASTTLSHNFKLWLMNSTVSTALYSTLVLNNQHQ